MNEKILEGHERICPFCGEEEQLHYEEYIPYFECDCEDAVNNRKIDEQINELRRRKPIPKFMVQEKKVLTVTKINRN